MGICKDCAFFTKETSIVKTISGDLEVKSWNNFENPENNTSYCVAKCSNENTTFEDIQRDSSTGFLFDQENELNILVIIKDKPIAGENDSCINFQSLT